MTRREDIAWVAGIFEGEGSFYVNPGVIKYRKDGSPRRRSAQRVATMQMTDHDVVHRFAEIVGVGNTYGPYVNPQTRMDGSPRKPSMRWSAGSFEDVQAFIAMVWPWLGERRRAAARAVLTGEARIVRGAAHPETEPEPETEPRGPDPQRVDPELLRLLTAQPEDPREDTGVRG